MILRNPSDSRTHMSNPTYDVNVLHENKMMNGREDFDIILRCIFGFDVAEEANLQG